MLSVSGTPMLIVKQKRIYDVYFLYYTVIIFTYTPHVKGIAFVYKKGKSSE